MNTNISIIEKNEVLNGMMQKGMKKVVYEFIDNYTNENTRRNYKRHLVKYCDYLSKELNINVLNDLNHVAIPEIRRVSTDFIKSYAAASTKRFVRSILASFWGELVESYEYKKNPIGKLRLEKVHNKSNTKSLCQWNLEKQLRYVKKYRNESQVNHLVCVLAHTLAATALRISEVLQITTDMVNDGEISITQKRGEIRNIELPEKATKMLKEYCNKYDVKGYVFMSVRRSRKTGEFVRLDRTNASRLLKKHTGISAHGFRKSVIEALIENGVHNHEVAKVSGHATINMVYYYDNRDSKTDAHKTFFDSITG